MITLQSISIDELKEYVYLAFDNDNELSEKYHKIEGASITDCVDETYRTIIDTSSMIDLEHYIVLEGENKIGYTCLSKNLLYSFGINVLYRTKYNLIQWIDLVKEKLNYDFICLLWSKNTRAINFMLNNGLVVKEDNIDYVILKNK